MGNLFCPIDSEDCYHSVELNKSNVFFRRDDSNDKILEIPLIPEHFNLYFFDRMNPKNRLNEVESCESIDNLDCEKINLKIELGKSNED